MNSIKLKFGDVRKKRISTNNDFVSHMIEHIAWRLGVEIFLAWEGEDWLALGEFVGSEIKKFPAQQNFGVALGMIDDGSSEIKIEFKKNKTTIESASNINIKWFLAQRCEQLESGEVLVSLLQGLAKGLGAGIEITICNFEDPHHTWEGVFRGIGTALAKIFTPQNTITDISQSKTLSANKNSIVKARALGYALASRTTAETNVSVGVDFTKKRPNSFSFTVNDSIKINGFERLLESLAIEGGFTVQIDFNSMVLSSSHVIMEDVGLVFGQACFEILKIRMKRSGINGAGSNLQTVEDLRQRIARVGISVEGRKYWHFTPLDMSYQDLKEKFLIGQNIYSNLRSEDLDDFVDGLSGGLSASIMVHIKNCSNAEKAWIEVFTGLGAALREVFISNPNRKGMPPGVKATLK